MCDSVHTFMHACVKWMGNRIIAPGLCVHIEQCHNLLEGYTHNYFLFLPWPSVSKLMFFFIEQVHIRGINCGHVVSLLQRIHFKNITAVLTLSVQGSCMLNIISPVRKRPNQWSLICSYSRNSLSTPCKI